MTQSNLAAALQRRQQTRKNLHRYVHTRSFNRLAGRTTAPGSARPEEYYLTARVMFALFSAAFFLVGIWFTLR